METQKILPLFYFSGTGNSRFIASLFCKTLNEKAAERGVLFPSAYCYSIEDFGSPVPQGPENLIAQADTVAFCYPVYGSLPPRLMREFVSRHADVLRDKKLIIFCTQLMFSGDGAYALTRFLPKKAALVIYAEHFNMPNSICNAPLFKVTNGEANKPFLDAARSKMERVCRDLLAGRVVRRGFNPFSRLLGLLQSATFPPVERKNRGGIRLDSDCVACGLCVGLCPAKNLELYEGGVRQKNNCTLCYRCVNACPKQAITVLFHTKPKTQYTGVSLKP